MRNAFKCKSFTICKLDIDVQVTVLRVTSSCKMYFTCSVICSQTVQVHKVPVTMIWLWRLPPQCTDSVEATPPKLWCILWHKWCWPIESVNPRYKWFTWHQMMFNIKLNVVHLKQQQETHYYIMKNIVLHCFFCIALLNTSSLSPKNQKKMIMSGEQKNGTIHRPYSWKHCIF